MHIDLPKINIKSFGGNPLEWLTFWDSFSTAIDTNLELSDYQNESSARYLRAGID